MADSGLESNIKQEWDNSPLPAAGVFRCLHTLPVQTFLKHVIAIKFKITLFSFLK